MNRRIGIIVAALVAVLSLLVVVVLPPLIGIAARSLLDGLDGGIPNELGFGPQEDVYVALDDWDAGWFSSTAYLSFKLNILGDELSTPVPVPVTLRHGPVLSGMPSGLGWASIELAVDGSVNPELLETLQQGFGVEFAYLGLGVLVGIWGSATIGVEVPESSSYGKDSEADFRGLEARATLSSDNIDLAGEFGGLRAVDGRDRIDIGRITFAAGATRISSIPGLWLGDAWINGTGFTEWDDRSGEGTEAGDFRLRFDSRIRGDVFDAALQGDVSQLLVDRVRLSDLMAEFSLQYGADALANLIPLVVRMRDDARDVGSALESFGSIGSVIGGLDSGLGMMTTAGTLLKERVAVGHRFSFTHEDRSASARLAAEFRGYELEGVLGLLDFLDFGSTGELFGNLAELPVSADLDMAFHQDLPRGLASAAGPDADVLAQLELVLRTLVRMGVFEAGDDNYTMRVKFDGGTLDINGRQMDLSQLIEQVVDGGLGLLGMGSGIANEVLGILGF